MSIPDSAVQAVKLRFTDMDMDMDMENETVIQAPDNDGSLLSSPSHSISP